MAKSHGVSSTHTLVSHLRNGHDKENTIVTVYHRTTNYHEITQMFKLLVVVLSTSHGDIEFADGGHEHGQCSKAVDDRDDDNTG